MTKTDKLHSMRFSSLLYPGVRQRIALKRSPMFMTPAPCWFPMTLMTLSLWHQMMMMASTKKSRKKKRQSRNRCRGDRINVVFLRLRLLSWRLSLRFSRGQDKICKNKKIQLMKNSRTLAAEICHTFQLCQSCRGGDWWPNSSLFSD